MAYAFGTLVALGGSKTGLTLLVQLFDTDGNDSGAPLATGFSERGNGNYYWYYAAFADAFRGGADVYESGVPGTILASFAINPEELENVDVKVSTRSTLAQSDILDDATPFSGANIDATISSRSDGTLVTLADSAITSAKYDESTAFPVKNDDSGATKIARTGADSDTLETLSDQMDVVQADLDNPDQYKADVSGLATAANVWAYSYRTLTEDATGNSYSVGNDKTVYKYSTIIFNLTLGNIDGIDDLVVTVKNDKNDTDESAIFQIRETTGLVYLWDTDIPTASDGTIVVTDAVAGNVIVTLKAASASLIPVKSDRYYDAKSIEGTESTVLATGVFNIVLPVTRTTV